MMIKQLVEVNVHTRLSYTKVCHNSVMWAVHIHLQYCITVFYCAPPLFVLTVSDQYDYSIASACESVDIDVCHIYECQMYIAIAFLLPR